jgi:hypothetical protein
MRPTVVDTPHTTRPATATTPAAEAGDLFRAAMTGLAAVAAVPRRTEKKKEPYRATFDQKSD